MNKIIFDREKLHDDIFYGVLRVYGVRFFEKERRKDTE